MAPLSEENWDNIYSEDEYVYGTEPNEFLKMEGERLFTFPKDSSRVLCLASGEGRNAVYLAQQDYNVTAVDKCPLAVEKTKKLASERGVQIKTVCADLKTYDFGNEKWDAIIMIFGFIDPSVRERVFRLIPFYLKKGGYFMTEDYTPRQLDLHTGGPSTATVCLSKQLLEGHFQKDLSVVVSEEKYKDVVEGKYHTGKSAVVDFVARKKTMV